MMAVVNHAFELLRQHTLWASKLKRFKALGFFAFLTAQIWNLSVPVSLLVNPSEIRDLSFFRPGRAAVARLEEGNMR